MAHPPGGCAAAASQADDVEPVEQVLAEAALFDRLLQVDVVAVRMRTSTWISSVPPTCIKRRSCRTRRILACISIDMVPISSRKMVPPLATSKRPFFAALRR